MKREDWTLRFEQVCKDVLREEAKKTEIDSMLASHSDPYVTAVMKMDAVTLPEGTQYPVTWGHGPGPCPDPTIQQAIELCTGQEKVIVLLLTNDATGEVIDKRAYIPDRILPLLERKPDDCRTVDSLIAENGGVDGVGDEEEKMEE